MCPGITWRSLTIKARIEAEILPKIRLRSWVPHKFQIKPMIQTKENRWKPSPPFTNTGNFLWVRPFTPIFASWPWDLPNWPPFWPLTLIWLALLNTTEPHICERLHSRPGWEKNTNLKNKIKHSLLSWTTRYLEGTPIIVHIWPPQYSSACTQLYGLACLCILA